MCTGLEIGKKFSNTIHPEVESSLVIILQLPGKFLLQESLRYVGVKPCCTPLYTSQTWYCHALPVKVICPQGFQHESSHIGSWDSVLGSNITLALFNSIIPICRLWHTRESPYKHLTVKILGMDTCHQASDKQLPKVYLLTSSQGARTMDVSVLKENISIWVWNKLKLIILLGFGHLCCSKWRISSFRSNAGDRWNKPNTTQMTKAKQYDKFKFISNSNRNIFFQHTSIVWAPCDIILPFASYNHGQNCFDDCPPPPTPPQLNVEILRCWSGKATQLCAALFMSQTPSLVSQLPMKPDIQVQNYWLQLVLPVRKKIACHTSSVLSHQNRSLKCETTGWKVNG